jgi:kumamolisin
MDTERVEIPGSAPQQGASERVSGPAEGSATVTASIILRRAASAAPVSEEALLSGNFHPLDRSEAAAQLGADPADIAAVERFAEQHGLSVSSADPATRTVKVRGASSDFNRAFGTSLHWADQAGAEPYLTYSGPLIVPKALGGVIIAVLGLDQKPVARPRASGTAASP